MPRYFNPETISPPFNPYSHGAEARAGSRLLFLAGQVGADKNGNIAADFEGQANLAYANIEAILNDAGMEFANLVKMTTFLINTEDGPKMREIRKSFLKDVRPPHTLLYVSRLANPEFLIEVEGVAAAD
ncbi:MAG TPA: RidA family protein [Rhodospirillales bacterium]|jgi:enamine deaminase RidA (YjgF/YER057c/UK114 family)|nr:RidA family protein [Rhodospirillales bacterium]HIL76361.1 RidA family protein [Rhodospirillales bacterium]